jgi:type IV pilus assembly protein PilA
LKLRQRMSRDESGFTLVELLVVMLILGMLIAAAIPTLFSQKLKANDADSKAMAHTAQTAIETYALDHGGSYTGADLAALQSVESTVDGTVSFVGAPTPTDYHVRATNPVTSHTFDIVRTGGTIAYPCAPADTGGCPPGGWGD